MRLGYNTNGFAHHRLEDAAEIIADIGYRSLAVTVERDLLDPHDRSRIAAAVARLNDIKRRTGLSITIETGARFILDPRRKHQPTLISADPDGRARRIAFLQWCIDLAAAVDAESVSLWSGAADDCAGEAELFDRLQESLGAVLRHAEPAGVRLSFEPEPDMLIDTMTRFARLRDLLPHRLLGLTLDIGHALCLRDGDIADHIRKWTNLLWNVHIEDMRPGTHEHLMFGEGEVDFPAVFGALHAAHYSGPIHVELSRHSHNAVEIAGKSWRFLSGMSAGNNHGAAAI